MQATSTTEVVQDDIGQDFADLAMAGPDVACDIETSGLDWRADQIGTFQMALPSGQVQVVQFRGRGEPKRLIGVLEQATTQKVFHHAPFDLRFMMASWNVTPANIACTKIASKILEPNVPSSAHSLKPLLERHLQVRISKEQQISNWTDPNLTESQITYAIADVAHLLDLRQVLVSSCASGGLTDELLASWVYLPTRAKLDLSGAGDVFAY